MIINPTQNYVLLKIEKKELKSKLELPENSDIEETQVGVILYSGPDSKYARHEKVLFKSYGFEDIILEGERYKIGKDDGIFAVLTDT